MNWHNIPGWPGYQIDARGKVRTNRGYNVPIYGRFYYLQRQGIRQRISKTDLLQLIRSAFLAERNEMPAAGNVAAERRHNVIDGRRTVRPRCPKEAVKPTRRCHDCGQPTNDYRCAGCWRKRRGFSAEEAAAHETPFAL